MAPAAQQGQGWQARAAAGGAHSCLDLAGLPRGPCGRNRGTEFRRCMLGSARSEEPLALGFLGLPGFSPRSRHGVLLQPTGLHSTERAGLLQLPGLPPSTLQGPGGAASLGFPGASCVLTPIAPRRAATAHRPAQDAERTGHLQPRGLPRHSPRTGALENETAHLAKLCVALLTWICGRGSARDCIKLQ